MLGTVRLSVLGAVAAAPIVLNPSTADHVYDGHGALSAGASSRLLWDYPEPQRSEILDYMFKPNFGASLHLLKVEIGGDAQSTDGTEPSPQHSRDEPTQCNRGYESWLLQEASKRNPSIVTYGLSWAVPHWIGNGSFFSQDNIEYQTNWAKCVTGLTSKPLDYIGIWNERSWGSPSYVTGLRQSLDDAGLTSTKIILPDGGGGDIAGIVSAASGDPAFHAAIDGIGLHYPCNYPAPSVDQNGWKFWASEDYSTVADWAGAGCWGRSLLSNYVRMNMTSTISWSLIWSVFPSLPYFGNGLMYAMEPWSGHYSGGGHAPGQDPQGDLMNGPLWTSAHFTQFTQPGWRFLSVPGGGSGTLPGGGFYVTLVPPSQGSTVSDFTLILATLEGNCLRCSGSKTTAQTVTFQVGPGMPGPGTVLAVWQTTELSQFVSMPSLTVGSDGSFSVSIPEDAMVTVTTLKIGNKGSFPSSPVPASAPFPVPYSDSFDPADYPYDVLPKYFSDQGGSFAVRNGTLQQVVMADPGSDAWVTDPSPITLIGGSRTGDNGPADPGWTDYSVTVTVTFQPNSPSLGSRIPAISASEKTKKARRRALKRYSRGGQEQSMESEDVGDDQPPAVLAPCSTSDPHQKWATNTPAAGYLSNTPYNNTDAQLCLNLDACGQAAIYYQCVTSGGTCCGSSCYAGLQWTLPSSGGAAGPIQSPLSTVNGDCLTVFPNGTISMQTCGSYSNQSWTYSRGGMVQLAGFSSPSAPLGLCLAAPHSLPTVYAQVCGRITGFSGFTKAPISGYCAAVDVEGSWYLRAGGSILGTGQLSTAGSGFNPATTPVIITLAMKGGIVNATFAPGPAQPSTFSVSDNTFHGGMAGLGSGYHPASFDDFGINTV